MVTKTATQRLVATNPAVRKIYGEVPKPLDDPQDDWERVYEVMKGHFHLTNLSIDHEALATLPKAFHEGDGKLTLTLFMKLSMRRYFPRY